MDKSLIFNRLESFNHNDFLPMNTKEQNKFNQLTCIFQEKTKWNLARVKFLVTFICTLCKLQTVNFQRLAQGFGGDASPLLWAMLPKSGNSNQKEFYFRIDRKSVV